MSAPLSSTCAWQLARDAIVSSTYRKLEQDGDKWRRLSNDESDAGMPNAAPARVAAEEIGRSSWTSVALDVQPLPRPDLACLGTLGDRATGGRAAQAIDPTRRLATLLASAAAPIRWEPRNAVHGHRGIPSPGPLFVSDILLLSAAGTGAMSAWRYLPSAHALARIPGCSAADEAPVGGFDVVIVGRLERCLTPYGDFSATLAALEAGHMQAQLAIVAKALGWRVGTQAVPGETAVRHALGLDHWTSQPFARMRVRGPGAAHALPTATCTVQVVTERATRPEDGEDYPRLRRFMTMIQGLEASSEAAYTTVEDEVSALPPALAGLPLADMILARSSGRMHTTTPCRPTFDRTALEAIGPVLAALRPEPQDQLGEVGLRLHLSVANHGRHASDNYVLDDRTGSISIDTNRRSEDDGGSNHGVLATLSIDDLRELQRWGPAAFLTGHVAAGGQAQRFSLAAAAAGLCVRPTRSYVDAIVDATLPLERRAIYQMNCSREPPGNIAYPVWGAHGL